MKNKTGLRIRSFEELQIAKQKLVLEIEEQEATILHHPVCRIPMGILQGYSFKSSVSRSVESISLENYKKAAIGLLSTVLMASRKTRKLFIAFVIVKELTPFLLQKAEEMLKKN